MCDILDTVPLSNKVLEAWSFVLLLQVESTSGIPIGITRFCEPDGLVCEPD